MAARAEVLTSESGLPAPLQAGELAPWLDYGIDRLSLSFRARAWQDLDRWDQLTRRREGGWSAQAKVGAPGTPELMVGARCMPNGAVYAKVECNPARFVDPDGCGLLPTRLLGAAKETMWAAAHEMVSAYDGIGVNDASVRRVDVARDFRGIMSPALYVDGLEPLARTYARRKGVWSDAHAGNAQTLHVGSAAGMVRLYDQHAAYAAKGVPEGSLRWECEARSGWLETVGVMHAGDLDPVVIDQLARQRWEWSRMGETVTGPVHAVDVLLGKVRTGELKRATAARLMGEMVFTSFGHGQVARTTSWRYRETMRSVGVTSETLWSDDLSRQAVGRLDFNTGTEFIELSA